MTACEASAALDEIGTEDELMDEENNFVRFLDVVDVARGECLG